MATLKERREAIESLKIPGRRTATLRQDADAWLRNWRNERGINPNSGVIPNDPAEAPAHLRFIIFGRRAQSLPQRDGMKIAHGGGGGWEHLGPEAKRRLQDEEYRNDVIKQVLDGTMSSSDGAQILQMEGDEFQKLMNELMPLPELESDSPDLRKLLIAPYNELRNR